MYKYIYNSLFELQLPAPNTIKKKEPTTVLQYYDVDFSVWGLEREKRGRKQSIVSQNSPEKKHAYNLDKEKKNHSLWIYVCQSIIT